MRSSSVSCIHRRSPAVQSIRGKRPIAQPSGMLDGVIAKLDDSKAHFCNEYPYWSVGNRLSLDDDAKLSLSLWGVKDALHISQVLPLLPYLPFRALGKRNNYTGLTMSTCLMLTLWEHSKCQHSCRAVHDMADKQSHA